MWRAARCQPISDARSEIKKIMVPRERIELSRSKAPRDFKSLASTSSATQALEQSVVIPMNMTTLLPDP